MEKQPINMGRSLKTNITYKLKTHKNSQSQRQEGNFSQPKVSVRPKLIMTTGQIKQNACLLI
jgi:hypothetical protein